jgi:hypothetical protein
VPLSRGVARPAAAAALALGAAAAAACATAMAWFGELSPGAMAAVTSTGALVAASGIARRAGAGSPAVGRPRFAWLLLAGAVAAYEAVALFRGDVPSLSALADPLLAVPAVRGAATILWLAAGAWLAARPTGRAAAAMRRTPGRAGVFAAWLWLGVHFLAR